MLLTWDDRGQLHLLNRHGQREGQARLEGLTAASLSDDGTACAGTAVDGRVWWLTPDLAPQWQRTMPGGGRALALDAFGQYLAVGGTRGEVRLFDRHGRTVWTATAPRPLSHLAFVPTAPLLVGAADFGLVVCFDMQGQLTWRDGLVAHVGGLAVNPDGSVMVLACFGQGLIRYGSTGQKLGALPFHEPCRLVASTFDGRCLLSANLVHRLFVLTADGQVLSSQSLGQPLAGLAFSALGEHAFAALTGGAVLAFDVAR